MALETVYLYLFCIESKIRFVSVLSSVLDAAALGPICIQGVNIVFVDTSMYTPVT